MEELIKNKLLALRREIHKFPDLSGFESATAQRILKFLEPYHPDKIIDGLGGYGLAAVFQGKRAGATVMFRAELDALPIRETNDFEHKSKSSNISHKCGHDGHIAILSGLGALLDKRQPERGSVVLLFQPSEETGEGARKVINDEKFKEIRPDYVFALHNLPGFSKNHIVVRRGAFTSASKGMVIKLKGRTAHVAEPEKGINPALAISKIIPLLTNLPKKLALVKEQCMVTIVYAELGEKALGTSPGDAEIIATLRSLNSDDMQILTEEAETIAKSVAVKKQLKFDISYIEKFPATVNDEECIEAIEKAAVKNSLTVKTPEQPFRWSEDFAHFTKHFKGALFGLGAGKNHPGLHDPYYDFPDEIIESGVSLFSSVLYSITALRIKQ